MTRQQTIEKATDWMESTAKDPKHGYDQIYRWGQKGDYDCSAAVITAWDKAGVDLKKDGATYTGNLQQALLKNDFKDITKSVDLKTGIGLKRGDILFAKGHHVAMYSGSGLEVEASINENGRATGGKPGDQTGREFLIRKYRNYPWTNVYRYYGGEAEVKSEKAETTLDHIHFKVTATNGLNVRKNPGGTIITALPHKSLVSFDDDQKAVDGWKAIDKYKVPGGEWKKLNGYCSSKWLEKV